MLVILLGTLCLMCGLEAKSLWVDELFTARIAREPVASAVITAVRQTEGRPPLYYLLLHQWSLTAGYSDSSLRLFSVLFAILCIPLLHVTARLLLGDDTALLASALFAIAPLLILYGRMARAYYMAVCLALVATCFFARLLDRETPHLWCGYIVSALLLLYTDYMTASILLAHNLLVLVHIRTLRSMVPHWIAGQFALLLGFLPWLPTLLEHTKRYQATQPLADLAQGPFSYAVKLVQPVLVFSTGETLLPWRPVALIGLPLISILALVGGATLLRTRTPHALLVFLCALVPVLFTVFIVTGRFVRYMTFAWIGARSLQAMPFYLLLLASGVQIIRPARRRHAATALMLAVFAVAGFNYYTNREFHNPVYIIPSREILRQVLDGARPGDVIVAPADSAVDYYYPAGQRPYVYFDSSSTSDVMAHVAGNQSLRVWLVTVGRDRGRSARPETLISWLESRFAPVAHWGYAEVAPSYRRIKEMLINREAYRYKAELTLYERSP